MKTIFLGVAIALSSLAPQAFAQELPSADYVIQDVRALRGFNDCDGKVLDLDAPGVSFTIGWDPDAPVPDSKNGRTGICKISVIHKKSLSLSGRVINVLWLHHANTTNLQNTTFQSTIAADVQAYRIP